MKHRAVTLSPGQFKALRVVYDRGDEGTCFVHLQAEGINAPAYLEQLRKKGLVKNFPSKIRWYLMTEPGIQAIHRGSHAWE